MNTLVVLAVIIIAVLGPAAVIAILGNATLVAIGRNPSAASKIFMGTFFMIIFVEVLSIVAMLIIFQLFAG